MDGRRGFGSRFEEVAKRGGLAFECVNDPRHHALGEAGRGVPRAAPNLEDVIARLQFRKITYVGNEVTAGGLALVDLPPTGFVQLLIEAIVISHYGDECRDNPNRIAPRSEPLLIRSGIRVHGTSQRLHARCIRESGGILEERRTLGRCGWRTSRHQGSGILRVWIKISVSLSTVFNFSAPLMQTTRNSVTAPLNEVLVSGIWSRHSQVMTHRHERFSTPIRRCGGRARRVGGTLLRRHTGCTLTRRPS